MRVSEIMKANVVCVSEDETLALAEQLMLWNRIKHLPVLRSADGQLTGMLGERELLQARRSPDPSMAMARHVRELAAKVSVQVPPEADVSVAASELSKLGLDCLPVLDHEQLVGIVTRTDLLRAFVQPKSSAEPAPAARAASSNAAPKPRDASVKSVMYREPIAVHEDDSLVTLAVRMSRARVRHACVVDGERRLIGIVSDRDLRRVFGNPLLAGAQEDESVHTAFFKVQHAMTPAPKTVREDQTVSVAARLLAAGSFGALPVVDDDGTLRGIVSYVDLLQYFAPISSESH